MSEPIRKSDLIQGDPIDEIRQDLDKTYESLTRFDDKVTQLAKTLKSELAPSLDKTVKGIKQVNEADLQSEKLIKQKLANEQQLIKVQTERERFNKAAIATQTAYRKEQERLAKVEDMKAKATARAAKAAKDEQSAYKQLASETRRLKNESKEYAAELLKLEKNGKRNTKEYRALARQYRQTSKEVQIADAQLKKIDARAGDFFRNVGNYEKSLGRVNNLLSKFGLALGVGAAVRGTVSMLTEYDEKLGDIAKTTGLTIEQSRKLSEELLKIDTRTPITELQELASAGGRLGVEGTANIVAFAQAADKVFVALGDDLEGSAEEIATNLGKISGLFGFEEEFGVGGGIERVGSAFNELSANSKASAGSIQDFTNRMAGLSEVLEFSDVAALGALFDEAGQSAEVSSSTLMKLLPELSKDFERFAQVAGKTPEEFKAIAESSPIEALKLVASGAKNNEKGLFNLTNVLESYGIESARASGIVSTLTNNVDRLTELQGLSKKAIEENTSITDEFNTKNETLSATYERVVNRIKAYILGSEGATTVSTFLKNALSFLAKNLDTIVKVMGRVIFAFVSFKAAMLALKMADRVKEWKEAGGSLTNLTKGLEGASKAAKAFGAALKGIGLSIAITLLAEVAAAFYDYASGAAAARRQQDLFNKAVEEGNNILSDIRDKLNKKYKQTLDLIKDQRAAGKLSAEEEAAQMAQAIKDQQKLIELKIKQVRAVYDEMAAEKELAIAKRDRLEEGPSLTPKQIVALEKARDRVRQLNAAQKATKVIIEGLRQDYAGLGDELINTNRSIVELNTESAKGAKDNAKAVKELNTQLEKQNEYLSEQTELLHELDQIRLENLAEDKQRDIEALANNLAKVARETAELDVDQLETLVAEKYEILKQAADERTALELSQVEERYRLEGEAELKELQENRDKLLAQKGLTAEQKEAIEASYQEQLKQYEMNELQRAADLELQKRLLKAKSDQELIDLERQKNDELNTLNDELIDAQIEGAEKLNEGVVETTKKTYEELYEVFRNIQEALTKVIEEQIDQRIKLLQQERDAAARQQDYLQELAANGNINAQQSITELIEVQREAQAEQIRLEKLKQQVELVSAGISTFNAELESGKKPAEALASTILTTQVLTGILRNIPFFAKGTDDAPEGWAVVDEQGAEIITDKRGNIKDLGTSTGPRFKYLSKGDKVHTATESARMIQSGIFNESATALKAGSDSAGNSFELKQIYGAVERMRGDMDKLQTAINIDFHGILGGAARFGVTTTKGGDKRTERYNIRP